MSGCVDVDVREEREEGRVKNINVDRPARAAPTIPLATACGKVSLASSRDSSYLAS